MKVTNAMDDLGLKRKSSKRHECPFSSMSLPVIFHIWPLEIMHSKFFFSFVYACMYETWMHEHVCDLSVETWVYYEHLHQLCSVIYMEASALTEPKAHWWANTASQLVRGSPVPHFKKLRFQAGCSICPRFIYVDAGDLTSRVFCIEPSP